MKKLAIGLLASWALLQAGAEEQWMTDLSKAQAKAKEEKKLVLMDFNGSDWCPPCKALKKNVFSSQEFIEYAKKNLVLVDVDFPRGKKQTEELKKANQELSEKFDIKSFPTVIVLSGDGKQLKRDEGYGGATAKDFIDSLEKLKKKAQT
jgi:thioredoxin-related protein